MSSGYPIGVERVLVLAAADEEFRAALVEGDRVAVAASRGLELAASEQALLRAVPAGQLEVAIGAMDMSQGNMERRSFLRTVAASAAVAGAAGAAAGCSDDADKPPAPDLPMATGIRPDWDHNPKDAGPPDKNVASPDAKGMPDHAGSFGIRPGG